MKKIFTLFLLGLFMQIQVYASTIPSGTLVVIQPQNMIDADEVRVGDTVSFVVVEPVKHDGQVIIKAGSEVLGTVTKRRNNSILGIPGELEVSDFKLKTQNGNMIRLRGAILDKADNRYWANIGWVFVFPLLFIKGNDGKIMQNTTHMLYTAEDINL